MREITAERAANEIRRAYGALAGTQTAYPMSLVDLRNMLDLTSEEITAGILHLTVTDRMFLCTSEANQKVLLPEEREAAIYIGDQPRHWITWY